MNSLSRRSVVSAGIAALVALAPVALLAQPKATRRVAIHGYDPVSYFTDNRPEQGAADYSFSFDDATYWFVSEQHRAMFAADPDKYAPRYNGFCALSMALGEEVEPNPTYWTVLDGKLYLFGEPPPGQPPSVQAFNQQSAKVAQEADKNWSVLHNTH